MGAPTQPADYSDATYDSSNLSNGKYFNLETLTVGILQLQNNQKNVNFSVC